MAKSDAFIGKSCCARVMGTGQYRSFHQYGCSKPVVAEVNGKFYCGTHHPDTEAKRKERQDARWKEESDRRARVQRGEAFGRASARLILSIAAGEVNEANVVRLARELKAQYRQ